MNIHLFDSSFSFFFHFIVVLGPGKCSDMVYICLYWFIMHEQGATQDFFHFIVGKCEENM